MKLKYITFMLENCDAITIDGKYVGDFLVKDIYTTIARFACNSINKVVTAKTFAIEIHKDANKERYSFNQTQQEDFKHMTFDRVLKWKDITSIEFELDESYVEDGQIPYVEHYDYCVNWVGDNDYENEAQINYISNNGHLYIVIAEGKSISDFFDEEAINDSSYTDFKFDMFDVGDKYGNPDRYKEGECNE